MPHKERETAMADKKEVLRDIFIVGAIGGAGYGGYKLIQRLLRRGAPDVDLKFATEVVNSLVAKLALRPTQAGDPGKIDRHRVFFIYRRAVALGKANPDLRTGPGLELLKERITAGFEIIDHFLSENLGTSGPFSRGPLYGGPQIVEPNHLDLGEMVNPFGGGDPDDTELAATRAQNPSESQARVLRELDKRRMRVIGIVWRAAAIETDLWSDDIPSLPSMDDLREILDRRLRSVERLQYQASAGATPDGIGSSSIERRWSLNSTPSAVRGPWHDGNRVRIFEAPSIPRAAASEPDTSGLKWEVAGFMIRNQNFIDSAGSARYSAISTSGGPFVPFWYLNSTTDEFDWNIWPPTRIWEDWVFNNPNWIQVANPLWERPPNFTSGQAHIGWVLKPRPPIFTAAKVIDKLFGASSDWWDRPWLHSDGVLSALHLEALRHALARRHQGSDDSFNTLPERFSLALDDYFGVRPLVKRVPNGIMQPGRTDYFENGAIPFDDLQIGDQVLFETNPAALALGAASWDYPTVLVTELDSSPDGTKLRPDQLKLQGFGTADLEDFRFRRLLVESLDTLLKAIQGFITTRVASGGTTPPSKLTWDAGLSSSLTAEGFGEFEADNLRQWNPYGDSWAPPGPWWVRIYVKAPIWGGAFGDDALKTLARIPGAFVFLDFENAVDFELRGHRNPSARFLLEKTLRVRRTGGVMWSMPLLQTVPSSSPSSSQKLAGRHISARKPETQT
jgi:hypothetical protein